MYTLHPFPPAYAFRHHVSMSPVKVHKPKPDMRLGDSVRDYEDVQRAVLPKYQRQLADLRQRIGSNIQAAQLIGHQAFSNHKSLRTQFLQQRVSLHHDLRNAKEWPTVRFRSCCN